MEKRTFGKSGLQVSTLGLGAAEVGYRVTSFEASARLLNTALDCGINVIDTAAGYADSEEKIGRALAHRRGEFYLFTKCGRFAAPQVADWPASLVEKSLETSLRRLRTDHVDLLLLHSCPVAVLKNAELIAAMVRVRETGKTRLVGYSGDSDAALYATGMGVFDALEISVNIADQEAIDRIFPEAAARGMGVIAKRPVANAAWLNDGGYGATYRERLKKLRFDFLAGDAAKAVDIALRFAVHTPGVHVAIVGTTRAERIAQNVSAVESGPLDPARYEAIRERWRAVAKPDWVGQG